jgi:glycosyltransferase involved in cell wall biosynthesis
VRLGVDGWRVLGSRTGVGNVILNTVRHWDAATVASRFDEITFYTPAPLDRGDVALPETVRERVLASRLPMLPWDNLRLGPGVSDDVLWFPSYSRPLFSRARRVVVSIYEATLRMHPEWFPRSHWYSFPSLYLGLYGWSAHHSALVIANTRAARDDIERAYRVPRDKIRVVSLAPAERFKPAEDGGQRAATTAKYVGERIPFFLFVGKMTPRRNVPMLMTAFARAKSLHSLPHKLVLVGLNTTGLDLQGLARKLGVASDLVHPGYVPDVDLVGLYSAATAFVLPYSYESLSLTTLEAQASGCPVITTDAPGLREVTGGEALYISQAEVGELSEALARLARDDELRARLSQRGWKWASQFSWKRTARETLDVLREAASLPAHMGASPRPRLRRIRRPQRQTSG